MADEARHAAPEVAKAASETVSQLLARILDQLAVSAWLPSAALTLLMAFVLELGSVLSGLGKTSIGGLILLVVVIVVLTMLTQAFSFESIRLLEGYWGTLSSLAPTSSATASSSTPLEVSDSTAAYRATTRGSRLTGEPRTLEPQRRPEAPNR